MVRAVAGWANDRQVRQPPHRDVSPAQRHVVDQCSFNGGSDVREINLLDDEALASALGYQLIRQAELEQTCRLRRGSDGRANWVRDRLAFRAEKADQVRPCVASLHSSSECGVN